MFASTRARIVTLLIAGLVGAPALFAFHYARFGWQQTHPPPTRVTAEKRSGAKLPNVGHGGYEQAGPAEYEQQVLGFLDPYLKR